MHAASAQRVEPLDDGRGLEAELRDDFAFDAALLERRELGHEARLELIGVHVRMAIGKAGQVNARDGVLLQQAALDDGERIRHFADGPGHVAAHQHDLVGARGCAQAREMRVDGLEGGEMARREMGDRRKARLARQHRGALQFRRGAVGQCGEEQRRALGDQPAERMDLRGRGPRRLEGAFRHEGGYGGDDVGVGRDGLLVCG